MDLINEKSEINIREDWRRGIQVCDAHEVLYDENSLIPLNEMINMWGQKKPIGAHSILTFVIEV